MRRYRSSIWCNGRSGYLSVVPLKLLKRLAIYQNVTDYELEWKILADDTIVVAIQPKGITVLEK